MTMTLWRKWLKGKFLGSFTSARVGARGRPPRRLALEHLEDRVTPSTLSLTGGNLQYLATSTETNNLSRVVRRRDLYADFHGVK